MWTWLWLSIPCDSAGCPSAYKYCALRTDSSTVLFKWLVLLGGKLKQNKTITLLMLLGECPVTRARPLTGKGESGMRFSHPACTQTEKTNGPRTQGLSLLGRGTQPRSGENSEIRCWPSVGSQLGRSGLEVM